MKSSGNTQEAFSGVVNINFKWTGIGLGVLSLVLFLVFESIISYKIHATYTKDGDEKIKVKFDGTKKMSDVFRDVFRGWNIWNSEEDEENKRGEGGKKDKLKITASLLLFVITVVAGLLVFFKDKLKVAKGLFFTLSVLVVVLVALESFAVHKLHKERCKGTAGGAEEVKGSKKSGNGSGSDIN